MAYYRPVSLAESLDILAERDVTIVSGATDLYPAETARNAWGDWRSRDLLDLRRVKGLRGVREKTDHYVVGAMTTWTDLVRAELPGYFHTLKQAALRVGSAQIQNRATIAGNICNASPAADGIPPLLTLDAQVVLVSKQGSRVLPLANFVLGNRCTAIRTDELVSELRIPKRSSTTRSGFQKLGARHYLVISIVMVSAVVEPSEDGTLREARIAVGSCSSVARRLCRLEQDLIGRTLDNDLKVAVLAEHFVELAPISDLRADAAYRRDAAIELIRRLFDQLVRDWQRDGQ